MKKFMVVIVMVVLVTVLKAQNKTNFCDPQLQGEVNKICAMGGTYLKDFLISPEDLKVNNTKLSYNAELVFKKDNLYRFYIKGSPKFNCEAILTLSQKASKSNIVTLHQKSNEAVAFEDFKIKETGVYLINVSFKDNVKGCALVILSYLEDQHNTETVDTSKVFTAVENHAQFQGGDINNFRKYVAENYKVDTAAMRGISDKIYVQFVVNKSGKVQDAVIMRSCGHPKLDNEALRVVKSSPLWSPAKIKGENVKEQFVIPIKIN